MTRILVADDHVIVREGLKQILAKTVDLTVAGEASNGDEVLLMIKKKESWDVLVMDMSMPGHSGLELISMVKKLSPQLPILVLSMYGEEQFAVRSIQAGASGYLNKESASDQLVGAIRKVAAGSVYVSTVVADILFHKIRKDIDSSPHQKLSNRELQVLQLIGKGHSINAIAQSLFKSPKTISTHKARILEKLGLKTQGELIRYVIENELLAN